MVTKWRRPIERSRPEYRQSLLRASLLFGLLVLAEAALIHQLVARDLSRRHILEAIHSYRQDVEQVARRLAEVLKQEGDYDLFTVKEKVTVITQRFSSNMAQRVGFHHISVYDDLGRMVVTIYRKQSQLITLEGVGAAPGPTAPPQFEGTREIPREGTGDTGRRPPSAEEFGPPAPVTYHLDTAQKESILVVPVPTGGPGADGDGDSTRAGVVQLGYDEALLEDELAQLRRDLIKKVVAGAFLSLVVLIVGFVYVLKLLQRTRRLEAEAQLADRLAYIGTLASGLAHEIRNPLNAMNMNLQILEEECAAGASSGSPGSTSSPLDLQDTRNLLSTTRGEIRRLDRLVNNFLAYARPSPLKLEERDLGASIEEIARFLRADFEAKGITLTTRIAGDLPRVEMDESQIRQAMLNMLVNASQILGRGGRVSIEARPVGEDGVAIEIADNGPGIPSGEIERVFEVFYSNRSGGTGLGLPIAQRIVENHGGRIEVESAPGQGTRFTIFLGSTRQRPRASWPEPEPARS